MLITDLPQRQRFGNTLLIELRVGAPLRHRLPLVEMECRGLDANSRRGQAADSRATSAWRGTVSHSLRQLPVCGLSVLVACGAPCKISLLRSNVSLIHEKFSLINPIGKCRVSRWITAVFCSNSVSGAPES
jgi:hypothetical protein